MKLVIFNGSPRFKKSNSALLIDRFLEGYNHFNGDLVPVHYLASRTQREASAEIFHKAETVLVVFPLYTDCMPGIVKEFFERIVQHSKDSVTKKIGFIVQSGFPESIHASFLEKYLKKLAQRLHCEYLGTVIKGGVEGIQIMPPVMTNKLFSQFEMLGESFDLDGAFEPTIVAEMRKPYTYSHTYARIFNLLSSTGLTNFYWNSNLKKNGAYEKRFDRPYLEEVSR
jgi:NAD(P)H-dependent FMN reductase